MNSRREHVETTRCLLTASLSSRLHSHRTGRGTRDAADGTRRTHARTRPHEGTRENANTPSSSVTVPHGTPATLRAHASRSPTARPPRRRARRARAASASRVGRKLAVRAHVPRGQPPRRLRPGRGGGSIRFGGVFYLIHVLACIRCITAVL